MSTIETDALAAHYKSTAALLGASPDLDLALNRALLDQVHLLSSEPAGVSYENTDAGGRPAVWCLPVGADEDRVIVYFHGGGFVVQSVNSHRKLAGHLARAAGCRVLLLDYRQAPESPYPAQIDDVEAAYGWLRGLGVATEHIAFAGDSAGACLAVTSVVRLRDNGVPLPAAIVGFSPWFDLECNGSSMETNAATDVFVRQGLVEEMAAVYLGGSVSPNDPLANPLHADLTGFPPVHLTASSSEALFDNAERFVEKAREAGLDVVLNAVPNQQHVFQYMAGRSAESDRSLAEAGAWVAERLGLTVPATL